MSNKSAGSPTSDSRGTPTREDRCICNWNKCAYYRKRLTEAGHELGGDCVRPEYSDTCNFQNFFRCFCRNLHVPHDEIDQIKAEFKARQLEDEQGHVSSGASNSSRRGGRRSIAKHHFTLEMVRMVKARRMSWIAPMTPALVEEWKCLPGSYETDNMLRYNPSLGAGRPERWCQANPIMYVKAPNANEGVVKAIVDSLDSSADGNETARLDIDQRRSEAQRRQDAARTPEEWRKIVDEQATTNSELHKVIAEGKKERKGLRKTVDDLKEETNRLRKQNKRAKTAVKESKSASSTQSYDEDEIVWDQVKELLSSAGGLSRMTIFSDAWHKKHPNAARLLFGCDTWAEAKQHIKDYFPDVNINMIPLPLAPTAKGGDIKLPDLSDFEQCLICRMFFHQKDEQSIIGLIVDRHKPGRYSIVGDDYWMNKKNYTRR